MTVVRPNSIAGINSITVQTGQALNIHDASGNLIRSLTNSSGISTFASINVTQGSGDLTVGISTLVVDNSAGKIGIGTVPARTLQVFAATPQVNLKSASGGTCELQFGDTGDEVRANIIYNSTDNYLGFNGYNNTERFRILSNGRIGINTSEATSALQIYAADLGEGTAKGQIILKDTAAYNASPTAGVVFQGHHASNNAQAIFAGIRGFKANTADGDYDGCLAFDVRTHGAVAYEAMRITEAGQVGINTTVPGRQLEVYHDTQGTIAIKSGDSGQSSLWLTDTSDSNIGGIYYAHSSNKLGFRVNDSERLCINSSGSVGVNEATPDFSGFGSNGGGIELDDVNSGFTALKVSHGSADMYLASAGSAAFISTRTNHDIVVEKNSTEVARFTADGLKVPSGKGIDFSAASGSAAGSSSALLDDYEEGTFTPEYSMTISTGTFGYAQQSGRYTKIGNMVHYQLTIQANSHSGTNTGMLQIAGLPFGVGGTQPDSPAGGVPFFIVGGNFDTAYGVALQINQSEKIEFYRQIQDGGNNYDNISSNELTLTSLFIKVSGFYMTT